MSNEEAPAGKIVRLLRAKPPEGLKKTIGLLIIQPTPFCNIDCDYCYLPNRDSNQRMPLSVLQQTLNNVFAAGMVGDRLSIVWHAGEPLALPISYYEEAFRAIENLQMSRTTITHSFQSNGTLINDEWCRFISAHDIGLGLSIDGPAFIHDAHRKTRRGSGTHQKVMRGVDVLRKHGIDFHVIAVITAQSLDFPDEIFEFYLKNGISRVGFNIEEIEGVNQSSTLKDDSMNEKLRRFFLRLYHLQNASRGAVKIREFDRAFNAIAQASGGPGPQNDRHNDQATPFEIISVDCAGNFSTFSPELLGVKSADYGDFCFGNVMTDNFQEAATGDKFIRVLRDINSGLELCAETCEYYFLCGGGAPSNKYFENGTFVSTETMYCNYTIKTPIDIVLADLEKSLAAAPPEESQPSAILD
jgi:uncharacterized protein